MIRTVLLCSSLCVPSLALAQPEAAGRSGAAAPMVVTSDTGAYCTILSRQIDQHADPLPLPVATLRDQGQRLCADGQVRSGINRLRRALLALQEPGDSRNDPDEEGRP